MFIKWFKKHKNNKAGFTLIELVVSIGILAVLGGVLVPTLISSANDARKDNDDAVMGHLAELHKGGAQEHDTYHYFAQTVDRLDEGKKCIYFWYSSDQDGYVNFQAMNLDYPAGATQAQKDEINKWAGQFRSKMTDYINGTIEMPVMESRSNKNQTYIVCISATNREYLVRVEGYWLPDADD